ncbi:hypothetical protein LDENG_00022610, partial [Lucifuga dentata]
MDGFYDQQVPFGVPESKCHTEEAEKRSDRKRKFMDTELAQDTEELFQDLSQLQEIWIAEAQVPDDEQFVPDFQSNNPMCHGAPVNKVKREPTPSTDLSPCGTPHAHTCLYAYSAYDDEPTGIRPLTPPSTADSRCGSAHPARQLHQLTNSCPPSHSPSHCCNLPQASQNQPFVVPRPPTRRLPTSRPAGSFSPEQRFHRQLSEPCSPYPSSGRPLYQRHLSEPPMPRPPQGFKQELVDPCYPDPGPPGPGPGPGPGPNQTAAFNLLSVKQEPRDFGFDSG